MVFLAWILGYASCSRSFCCLPNPSSYNSTRNLSWIPDICSFQVSKGGLHRCKFWLIIKIRSHKINKWLIYIFSLFLAEKQMRATPVLQLEAGGSLCNLKIMKEPNSKIHNILQFGIYLQLLVHTGGLLSPLYLYTTQEYHDIAMAMSSSSVLALSRTSKTLKPKIPKGHRADTKIL